MPAASAPPPRIICPFDMPGDGHLYRFGPFELDSSRLLLARDGKTLMVPTTHVGMLAWLLSRPGKIATRDELLLAGWGELIVSLNSVDHGMSGLRAALGPRHRRAIETVPRKGYRFTGAVQCTKARTAASLRALLAAHRRFVDGRAGVETLSLPEIDPARAAFKEGVDVAPDDPANHVGLATACLLLYESTRVDIAPNVEVLQEADRHARLAWQLNASYAEAWATHGIVLNRLGQLEDAIAAVRKANLLEADNWLHLLRLASVESGEARFRAARRALVVRPGFAFAYWFAGGVFVARQAFDFAIADLRLGCEAQDAQYGAGGRFHALGLHYLLALVLAAQGKDDEALEHLARERARLDTRHVYARECDANSCYATAGIHFRHGRLTEADSLLREALTRVPGFPPAAAALAAMTGVMPTVSPRPNANPVDVAIVKAIFLAVLGRHQDAAQLCEEALTHIGPGSAGWLLPVDPFINPTARPDVWARTLAAIRNRA